MKNITLHLCLLLGLSACNEGSRETTDSPEKSTITETRYESTVNQTLNEAEQPNSQAPNFRFRDSFTEPSPSNENPTIDPTNSVAEETTTTPTTPAMEAETVNVTTKTAKGATKEKTSDVPAQQTANVVNLPENDTLNVRKRAGTNNPILEKLAPNSEVIVTGATKTTKDGQEWFEIITEKKNTGWVNNHYLKLNK